jgi:hypothetical protein
MRPIQAGRRAIVICALFSLVCDGKFRFLWDMRRSRASTGMCAAQWKVLQSARHFCKTRYGPKTYDGEKWGFISAEIQGSGGVEGAMDDILAASSTMSAYRAC